MPVCLVPVGEGQRIVLEKAVVFLGRHPECDVILAHSQKISRKHCCIAQVNHTFVVRDLGSMNGIRVNGRSISSEAPVKLGDTIAIGDCHYVLKRVDQMAVARPVADSDLGAPAATGKAAAANVNLSQDFPVPLEESAEGFVAKPKPAPGEVGKKTPVVEPAIEELVELDDEIEFGDDELYRLDENSGEYELLPD